MECNGCTVVGERFRREITAVYRYDTASTARACAHLEQDFPTPMARRSLGKARPGSWRAFRPEAISTTRVAPVPAARTGRVRVLGLDPGSLRTGYGVIEVDGPELTCIAQGTIDVQGDEFALRLRRIHEFLAQLLVEHRPDEIAIERVFVSQNVDSALKLGQARGAALAAVPREISVHEYAPRAVKMAVVGSGAAAKVQIQHMVVRLLQLPGKLQADAADALAIAICHANHRRLRVLEATALTVSR
jgi:crossover junction endodeoxyribonuclease RuvC